jgi:uncharacterized repeat protein (TIGR03803 family)
VIFEIGPDQKETVRYTFVGGSDGVAPSSGLLADGTGNFYGITGKGGGSVSCGYGCGTVFELAADGTESVLHAFQGGSDGFDPSGTLVADQDGDLYGETIYGGSYDGSNCDIDGCGTVFEIQPGGTKLTLHSFQSGSDGAGPTGGLVIDAAGNLYGTTGGGGGSGCSDAGCGTVFQIAPDGTESILYAFQGDSDGSGPIGLVLDSTGNLYGVTGGGGNCSSYYNDCGTIYKLSPDGVKTLLYSFKGGSNGRLPDSALIMDKAGNLYGTTFLGGRGCKKTYGGCGVAFELARNGQETTLYEFKHNGGANPSAPGALLLGARGELYGTLERGGIRNNGAVFKIKK